MDAVRQANRTVAAVLAETIGGRPSARRYYLDAQRGSYIDVAAFVDRPQPGVTTFSTLGLSDTRIPRQVDPPLGVELIGACDNAAVEFPALLAAITSRIRADPGRCEPGAVFDRVVPGGLSDTMRHAVLVPPFLWEPGLRSRVVDYKTVAWLLVVPISEAERSFRTAHGFERLEAAFADARIDLYNPRRLSCT